MQRGITWKIRTASSWVNEEQGFLVRAVRHYRDAGVRGQKHYIRQTRCTLGWGNHNEVYKSLLPIHGWHIVAKNYSSSSYAVILGPAIATKVVVGIVQVCQKSKINSISWFQQFASMLNTIYDTIEMVSISRDLDYASKFESIVT